VIVAAAFVVAAAAGALARAEAGRRWNRHEGLALGTMVVNITGSFLLGLLADMSPAALTVIGVGALGAFTTFSSFARDAVALAEQHRLPLAAIYVGASSLVGIAAAAAGIAVAGLLGLG
jgi:CrcB protein